MHSDNRGTVLDAPDALAARLAGLTPERRALLARRLADVARGAATATSPAASDLVAGERPSELPLSYAQQRLWFLDQLEPHRALYNLGDALRWRGPLDQAALQRSLDAIVARHEVLRTTFAATDGRPRQIIQPPHAVALPVDDLSALSVSQRAPARRRLSHEEIHRPFDLANGPLFRARLLRLADRDHVLLLTHHHIVSDAWSIGIFFDELRQLYAAYADGRDLALPPMPLQYADYACWQRERQQDASHDAPLAYWRKQLAGRIEPFEVPATRPRPEQVTTRGRTEPVSLPAPLAAALRRFSQQEGATLFMTLLSAFYVLLHRYSGNRDLVVGTPVAGRERPELDRLIGLFINTVALRVELSGSLTARELIRRVRDVALQAYAHQTLPFDRIVDELQPERQLGRTPFFNVMFALHQTPADASWSANGLSVQTESLTVDASKFDLSLLMAETGDAIEGGFTYRTDLWDRPMVRRMVAHYEALLQAIVDDPSSRIDALPFMSADERGQIAAWNETNAPVPPVRGVHELFEAQVRARPQAPAAVCGDERLTFAELNQRADALAARLRRRGVAPETRVGLFATRSLAMITGMLATLKAGAAYVPLDPALPADRIAMMLEDSRPVVVLAERESAATLPATDAIVLLLDEIANAAKVVDAVNAADVDAGTDADAGAGGHTDSGAVRMHPAMAAYVLYTSGSTGRPKGVVVEHRQVVNYVEGVSRRAGFGAGQTFAMVQPLAFDSSGTMVFPSLCKGGCLHVVPDAIAKDPVLLGDYFERERIDCLKITPSHLAALQSGGQPQRLLPRRALVLGGEGSRREWLDTVQAMAPGCAVINHYGPTETTVGVLVYLLEAAGTTREPRTTPLGWPIGNVRRYVLDAQGEPVPIGVKGELYIGGAALARGYLNHPALTATRFVPSPFARGERLYRTGDQVRGLEDGTLEFLGRVDHQVKIRGFRVELGEIESALATHPAVRQAAVVLHENAQGQGQRLAGYIVARDAEAPPRPEDLARHLAASLPDYMVPASIVVLEEMPLTVRGKIDRQALPDAPVLPDLAQGFEGPRTPTEEALCRIWSELLHAERVGIHDNFFQLGGDSIISIQVLARAARAGIRLTASQLFRHQTVAGLASVADADDQAGPAADQGRVTGLVPLGPVQHWFFARELPDPHHYNQSVLLEPQEPLDAALLETAVARLIAHHDALTFRYRQTDRGWEQRAGEPGPVPIERVDLSTLTGDAVRAAVDRIAAERQASLDLANGPLLRVVLFDRGHGATQRLLIVIHHLVVDGVSWRVLLEDLAQAYRQVRDGQPVSLPPKTASFQAWTRALAEHVRTKAPDRDLLRAVPGSDEETWLPIDRAGGANTVETAREVEVRLSPDDTRALLQEVPAALRTRIDAALLTTLGQAFARWTGRDALWVSLEGHGREALGDELDLSRTVGWFTAIHPMRLDLRDEHDIGRAVAQVQAQLERVPQRGSAWSMWRYLSQAPDILSHLRAQPRPNVCFNYLGQFDQTFGPGALFRGTGEPHGATRGARGTRAHVIEISGEVVNHALRLVWTYSSARHDRATIARVAHWHAEAIQSLLAHVATLRAGAAHLGATAAPGVSLRDLDALRRRIAR